MSLWNSCTNLASTSSWMRRDTMSGSSSSWRRLGSNTPVWDPNWAMSTQPMSGSCKRRGKWQRSSKQKDWLEWVQSCRAEEGFVAAKISSLSLTCTNSERLRGVHAALAASWSPCSRVVLIWASQLPELWTPPPSALPSAGLRGCRHLRFIRIGKRIGVALFVCRTMANRFLARQRLQESSPERGLSGGLAGCLIASVRPNSPPGIRCSKETVRRSSLHCCHLCPRSTLQGCP